LSEFWFACLKADEAVEHWDRIEELLAPCIEKCRGEMDADDVLTRVADGTYLVGVMGRGTEIVLAIVLHVIHFPKYAVLDVAMIGGTNTRTFAKHYFSEITDFAREIGCREVQCTWRDAEARLFSRMPAGKDAEQVYAIWRLKV
jgi:hypothetical protein